MNPWVFLAIFAAVGLVVAASMVVHLRRAIRTHRIPLPYERRERLLTDDGAVIELRRIPGGAGGTPVVMVHGLAANHRNIDFHPDLSLARHLAAAGRDVWLLTLRSGRRGRTRAETGKVTFEAIARHDLLAGVRAVRERTRSGQVDYIGFSMGGMVLYAALGRDLPSEWVRRVVIIGSPGEISSPMFPQLVRWLRVPWVPTLFLDLSSSFFAPLADWFPKTPLHRIVYNPDNVDAGVAGAALVDVIVDVPGKLSKDFVRWATGDGQIRLSDGAPVLEGLRDLKVPARFFAGAADMLAPPASVEKAFTQWAAHHGETDKHFQVLGRDGGHAGDYGHGDLAVGRGIREDLFEPIASFLTT